MSDVPQRSFQMPDKPGSIYCAPEPLRELLRITPEFRVQCKHRPNAWRRFWYWALLGWRWERL